LAEQHPADLQRPVRQHRLEGRRQDPPGISEEIPAKVAADKAYQNAKKHSDRQNARIEHDNALLRVMNDILADHTELCKHFSDNESFKKWLADMVFGLTYEDSGT
jgi:type I restriction enzyme, R subunit